MGLSLPIYKTGQWDHLSQGSVLSPLSTVVPALQPPPGPPGRPLEQEQRRLGAWNLKTARDAGVGERGAAPALATPALPGPLRRQLPPVPAGQGPGPLPPHSVPGTPPHALTSTRVCFALGFV